MHTPIYCLLKVVIIEAALAYATGMKIFRRICPKLEDNGILGSNDIGRGSFGYYQVTDTHKSGKSSTCLYMPLKKLYNRRPSIPMAARASFNMRQTRAVGSLSLFLDLSYAAPSPSYKRYGCWNTAHALTPSSLFPWSAAPCLKYSKVLSGYSQM